MGDEYPSKTGRTHTAKVGIVRCVSTPSTVAPQGEQIYVDVDPVSTLAAYARHRRRFAAAVASLDDESLAAPSRCSKWSVADVLRHGHDVDGWMQAIWSGDRPPFTSFDPTTTPHEYVLAGRSIPDAEARDRYVASAETMAADVGASGPERWGLTSVSPVGFVPWWLSAFHVFYDSWVHERDVFVPLDVPVPVESDEAVPVLAYNLAIVGTLITEPTDAVIGGVRLVTGERPVKATPDQKDAAPEAADIVDALSGRGDVEEALSGVDPDVVDRLGVLARIFRAAD
jgi:uncharacterized protein (TIGR03083 family)